MKITKIPDIKKYIPQLEIDKMYLTLGERQEHKPHPSFIIGEQYNSLVIKENLDEDLGILSLPKGILVQEWFIKVGLLKYYFLTETMMERLQDLKLFPDCYCVHTFKYAELIKVPKNTHPIDIWVYVLGY